jgi:hypothetical protein
LTTQQALRVKAYRSYEQLYGLKEYLHEQGFNDGWRELTNLILQSHPELKQELQELSEKEWKTP